MRTSGAVPALTEVRDLVARLEAAMNAHDVDAFVGCFDPRYESEQPIHPAKRFTGTEQVRRNWSTIFEDVPDFRAEQRTLAVDGDTRSPSGGVAGGEPTHSMSPARQLPL